MAIPLAAASAASAVAKYGPNVVTAASDLLKKATGGRLSAVTPQAIQQYVGASPQRMQVIADSLVRAGVRPDEVVPDDLMSTNDSLAKIRASAEQIVGAMRLQFKAGEDKVLPGAAPSDAAADSLRILRVRTALRIYGSERDYFLCHPTGGIPPEDFAYVRTVQKALYSR